jgi:hypothetical protein
VERAHDIGICEVLECDESFLTALLRGDHDLLGAVPADDFVIVDVLSGQVASRDELLAAISSGQLRFAEMGGMPENGRSGVATPPRWWSGGPPWSCATGKTR